MQLGDDMIGTSVDRYEILEELGHGGMSVVYLGMDSSLEREVAVKVLHNHLAKKLENRRRFHREAKAIARLRHPNILEIYDFSSEDADRSYIVMEYVAGENLRQFVARTGTPPPEIAALVGIEICNALEHAHDHGIIHRDLKPENIMVSSGGVLKLMDFGIAHVIDAETMTATGSLMGSPAHMAPELIDGVKVDVRVDVFALGTVLYWLATGVLPFDGANAPQVLRRVLEGDYDEPELVEPRVDSRLAAIIRCCLSHDPDDRYSSAMGARKALQEFAATLGAPDPALELKRYLKNPQQYRVEFEAAVVGRLTALARQAHRDGDVPGAIGLFNRILAYDPGNAEVQRLLDKLCRRDRWRRTLPWAALALTLIAGITAVVVNLPPAPPQPAQPAPTAVNIDEAVAVVSEGTEAATEAMAVSIADAHQQAGDQVRLALRDGELVANTRAPLPIKVVLAPPVLKNRVPDMGTADTAIPEPAAPTHRWRFSVVPAAATFKIDSEEVTAFEAASGVELTEGIHMLSARGQGTKPWSKKINVSGPDVMPVVLEWENGRVQVNSNVPAVVWFQGKGPRPIGTQGTFGVPFGRADSTENKKEITVRVAPADNVMNAETRTVTVQPGGTATVKFNFSPSP